MSLTHGVLLQDLVQDVSEEVEGRSLVGLVLPALLHDGVPATGADKHSCYAKIERIVFQVLKG